MISFRLPQADIRAGCVAGGRSCEPGSLLLSICTFLQDNVKLFRIVYYYFKFYFAWNKTKFRLIKKRQEGRFDIFLDYSIVYLFVKKIIDFFVSRPVFCFKRECSKVKRQAGENVYTKLVEFMEA